MSLLVKGRANGRDIVTVTPQSAGWKYVGFSAHRLAAGESVSFDKLWGFTVDTGHEHVRYTFRTCWHGVGETVRQCRTQWVDVLP